MRIGIPAEKYPGEGRVAATPETVKKLVAGGRHTVIVESGAGVQASIPDNDFVAAGASLGCDADVYNQSDIILKVRRPEDVELPLLRRGTDRKSTRLNSSHSQISYAVFCLKKQTNKKAHGDV